ncbi:hypothetical protein [Endozoicomonas sp.]
MDAVFSTSIALEKGQEITRDIVQNGHETGVRSFIVHNLYRSLIRCEE